MKLEIRLLRSPSRQDNRCSFCCLLVLFLPARLTWQLALRVSCHVSRAGKELSGLHPHPVISTGFVHRNSQICPAMCGGGEALLNWDDSPLYPCERAPFTYPNQRHRVQLDSLVTGLNYLGGFNILYLPN